MEEGQQKETECSGQVVTVPTSTLYCQVGG